MAKASRDKGKRGEREVVHELNERGIPCDRDWEGQSRPGGQANGDLKDIPVEIPLDYAEIRFRETLSIPAWLREIEERAPEGARRALIFRRSREPWHVALPLDQYIDLLKLAGKEHIAPE